DFAELQTDGGFDVEGTMRRLYALCVLGFADTIEAIAAMPAPIVAAPPPEPHKRAPVEPQGLAFLDEDEGVKNALASEFLEHRRKDPFELLGLTEDAQPAALSKAFLAASG